MSAGAITEVEDRERGVHAVPLKLERKPANLRSSLVEFRGDKRSSCDFI